MNSLLRKTNFLVFHPKKYLSTEAMRICLIGAGPACFHLVDGLVQRFVSAQIDIYEKSIVPFGLLRTGIAPDHQPAKNMETNFTKVFRKNFDRLTFNGNMTVGVDVSLAELRDAYHVTVLCYGAQTDRRLEIPGEELNNVISAREFVGWYNGVEEHSNLKFNLNIEDVAVIGNGNVALDVSRILLKPIRNLKVTDICDFAITKLSSSRVKRVHIIGRSGPINATCTTKELREMIGIPECEVVIRKEDLMTQSGDIKRINDRGTQRRFQLMLRAAETDSNPNTHVSALKKCIFHFWKKPVEITALCDDLQSVGGIRFAQESQGDFKIEHLPVGLVIRSIGYKSLPIENEIPFNISKGIVDHVNGRVRNSPGLYCCGWVKTGPVGPVRTLIESFETADVIKEDLINERIALSDEKPGKKAILQMLNTRGIRVVNFDSWLKIDAVEKEIGKAKGKPREKIISKDEMFNVISQ